MIFGNDTQQLVDSADALQESTGRRRSKPVGSVRVSVPVALGLYLSSKFAALLQKHEELSIDLVLHDKLLDVIEERIDLQVCVGQVSDSSLISRRIGTTTAFLVAAPRYLTGRATPEQPADLQKHDCIVYHRWGRDDVWWFASPEGTVSVPVRGRFRANNAEAVRRATPAIADSNDGHIIWFGAVLLLYSLFQMHSYAFARLFPNSRTNIRLDGQHVLSVAHSHK